MLTAIEIENFKAFGERQRIELRPITLLFGPNSGGKSSVTHALHYLREVLLHRNLDAHLTRSGGESLDLGGIRNFVHGQQMGTPIRLTVEFNLGGEELPDYSLFADEGPDDDVEQILRQVKSASVTLEIDSNDSPKVRSYAVSLNGEPIAEYWMPRERPHAEVRNINWLHPILMVDQLHRQILDAIRAAAGGHSHHEVKLFYEPKPGEHVPLTRDFTGNDARGEILGVLARRFADAGRQPTADALIEVPLPVGPIPDFDSRVAIPNKDGDDLKRVWEFEAVLSMLLFGPVTVLRKRLADLRYVGPLRTMPPRQFEPRDRSGRSRWATGLQAWELLVHGQEVSPARREGEGSLLEEVSKWLEAVDRLDTGYRLEREAFKRVPSNIAAMISDPEYVDRRELLAETIKSLPDQARILLRDVRRNLLLQPQDVGVGLSQIVPVIVALLNPGASLVALEQPELHLHPRQQAALGDALIKGLSATPNRVLLVETHSEHVILRLLRRIRESTAGEATRETALQPEQVSVVYVQPVGTNAVVTAIPVSAEGEFTRTWPNGFFAERVEELL